MAVRDKNYLLLRNTLSILIEDILSMIQEEMKINIRNIEYGRNKWKLLRVFINEKVLESLRMNL